MYASRNRNYWKRQNVLSEPFGLSCGTTFKLLFSPVCEVDVARYKKYGKLFGAFEMGKAVLFVGDSAMVKKILVEDFSSLPNRRTLTFNDPVLDYMMSMAPVERWRDMRVAATQAFSAINLRKMNTLIEECALVTAEHLKKAAFLEENIELRKFFGDYALDLIARCAFATKLDSHSNNTSEFIMRSKQAPSGRPTLRVLVYFLFPAIAKATGLLPLKPSVLQYFKTLCQNIINSDPDNQPPHPNFLRLLMSPEEKHADAPASFFARDHQLFSLGSHGKQDAPLKPKLTGDQAMAQCLLFFLAGKETTARAVSYTLYLLAIHPDVQEKLRNEVDECFKSHGDRPDLEAVTKLKYLHCVVSESLRMYPPVHRLERTPVRDYVLGDTGVKLKKCDLVTIPVYAMHHDPEYFRDPLKFDPERFNEINVASIHPYTYLPFGAGPRNCVAFRFALQAVKLCVLHSIRNVQFVRTGKTKVPLEFKNGLGLLTAKDITVGVKKRP
uniref:Putative cytochrome p450 cyp3/cyp5/cyp6/cyp9 subfamily n=1 Tax=Amblyomma triste TaxID=251400 RepID=A0A023GKT5_AMBTT